MLCSMTPAERIIEKLGGEAEVAKLAGITMHRVRRWTFPRERGGTDGKIPTRHQQTILDEARKAGVEIAPSDFFEGGT